ncbi:MAG: glycine cleavage system protein H, partial [Muribaculaceae bacterium]|nr:glycine cleavage system protein H [Muribaculaceae bacterium]
LINQGAYRAWIMKVKVSDESEIENLLNAEAYAKLCEE